MISKKNNETQMDLKGDYLDILNDGYGSENNRLKSTEHEFNIDNLKGYMVPQSARGAPAIPNSLLGFAIFTAKQSRDTKLVTRKPIAASANIQIYFTGWELTQYDATVWETIIALVKDFVIGTWCSFTLHEILLEMGKTPCKTTYAALRKSLDRLRDCRIHIQYPDYLFSGGLMHNANVYHTKDRFDAKLDEEIFALYHLGKRDDWTFIDRDITKRLSGSPLALRLYRLIAIHQYPRNSTLDFYQERTDYGHVTKREFKRKMKTALRQIQKVGFLKSSNIDDESGKVHVERKSFKKKSIEKT